MHVAERLKDPADALHAAAAANAQSQFPAFTHWSPPSIGQGNAGLCLLWAYLDQCFPEQRWDITGRTHLEIAGRAAESSSGLGTGLFSGLSGLAFAGWQLSRGGTRYQRFLLRWMTRFPVKQARWRRTFDIAPTVSMNDFDVISGLSGIGAYLLSRHEEAVTCAALGDVVGALISLVTRDEVLPAWHTPAHLLFDDTARNELSVRQSELRPGAWHSGSTCVSLVGSFDRSVVQRSGRSDRYRLPHGYRLIGSMTNGA